MANAFLSETDTAIGTSSASVLTCGASTETTVIGMSIANIVTSQILVDVQLDASGRTSGAEDSVYLVKSAPVPVGGSLVVVGGDQKVVMEPGDVIKVTSDTASSADVVISHLDIT
jgi:hypothetical protein|tara:strand:- start:4378 stop:4722 length:345 start_codon:yes stop_codon:yes gene_type:complete